MFITKYILYSIMTKKENAECCFVFKNRCWDSLPSRSIYSTLRQKSFVVDIQDDIISISLLFYSFVTSSRHLFFSYSFSAFFSFTPKKKTYSVQYCPINCIPVCTRILGFFKFLTQKYSGDNSFITTWLLRKCPKILVLFISHSFLE